LKKVTQRTEIIHKNRDFLNLYRRGKKVGAPYIVVYVRKNRRQYNRLGITVGKKVGNAVKRNHAKRVIRAAYRQAESAIPLGLDIIIVATPKILEVSSTQLGDYLMGSCVKRMKKALQIS